MVTVRAHVVRCALLAVALLGFGCRGEAKKPVGEAKVPADEKLAWPAVDEPSLVAAAATEGWKLGARCRWR